MKKLFILIFFSSLLLSSVNKDKSISQTHLKTQMEKEKKYAQEQKFYSGDEYDLKGAEVDQKSLDYIDAVEPDDLDMDHVYD